MEKHGCYYFDETALQSCRTPSGEKTETAIQTPILSIIAVFCTRASHLLQIIHMWKVKFHKLPTSFPHKRPLFPHSLRMRKTYQHIEYPQKVFHIFAFFQAKSRSPLWKTMWKVWKISTYGIRRFHAENRFPHPGFHPLCGKAGWSAKPFWQRSFQTFHDMWHPYGDVISGTSFNHSNHILPEKSKEVGA